jgi:hypothetical protein
MVFNYAEILENFRGSETFFDGRHLNY